MTIFVTEILFRIYAMRFDFFKDPWCIFDFIIVGIALFPSTGVFRVFRVFRVLRAFRLVSRIPELKLVAESLLNLNNTLHRCHLPLVCDTEPSRH